MKRLALMVGMAALGALTVRAGVCWDEAWVEGHMEGGDRLFYKAGEEMVFRLELKGVKGDLPAGAYFYDWTRTANDGRMEKGRAPVEKPLVIRTSLNSPGFVRVVANVVDAAGKRVPKNHMWEKRVFFQGGAGVDVERLEAWPEPADFDAHWAAEKKLVSDKPLEILERRPLACANDKLNLWQVKIAVPGPFMPCTGYLAVPKTASAANRVKATGMLSGYYMWGETCPEWLTNKVDGIRMYINRHGCEGDREEAYYKPFLKNGPYGPDHFRGMALRGLTMFKFLMSLPEWDGKTLESWGSSGGAMQSLWMAALVPEITRIDCQAPALGDIFGFQFGRETGNLARRDSSLLYYDICSFARRIRCSVALKHGLGDTVCTPASIAIVYNNLRCEKSVEWFQGATHGWWPKGMAHERWSSAGAKGLESRVDADNLTAGKGTGGDVLRAASDLKADVQADVARPVRPAGIDGQPFWNGHSTYFIYPPSFDFKPVAGAAWYRFMVIDDRLEEHVFDAVRPTDGLGRVWGDLPTGIVKVICFGITSSDAVCGIAGERTFWKGAPYRPGTYPKRACSYGTCAARAADHIFAMTNTQSFVETGRPDSGYELNCYPAKMASALIDAMISYAKRRPERRDVALKAAVRAADWLLSVSQKPGTPLAHFPPTYAGTALKAKDYAGQNMLLYPAIAGTAYLNLAAETKERRFADAARLIGETYLRLQGADGTWFLKLWESDGRPVVPNRLAPIGVVTFLERLYETTGDIRWRLAADRAFGFIEKGPLANWNWEAQFEDVEPHPPYRALTHHHACSTAIYLLKRFPGDAHRLRQARELVRFSEDQFVYWETPCRADGRGILKGPTKGVLGWRRDYLRWFCPGVGEQYGWEMPIDSAAAKVGMAYLALYEAEGRELDLAKARTLGDSMTRIQKANGSIRTQWLMRPDADNYWLNCMAYTITFLDRLARVSPND